jgi:hypothetical protein
VIPLGAKIADLSTIVNRSDVSVWIAGAITLILEAAMQTIELDDSTLHEVAELAAGAGVVLVERGGQMALCGAANVPAGWHRVGVTSKGERHATAV